MTESLIPLMQKNIQLFLLTTFLASCSGTSDAVSTVIPPAETAAPQHAPEIRFGLIGAPNQTNPWMLFDESGATYNDYALRADYYPRLYRLAPDNFEIYPSAAEGFPSAFELEGESFVSTVSLRKDLKWTDGSPFTAYDVAFTVNTALAFELDYDWGAQYRREMLLRAEAAGDHDVRFYFKQKPNVEVWQYGAMQGVVLQEKYWSPKIKNSENFLPDDELRVKIESAQVYVDKVQFTVDDISAKIASAQAVSANDPGLDGLLRKRSEELIYAQNQLNELLDEYRSKIDSAQADLFALNFENEPVLGVWVFSQFENDEWVNAANPALYFAQPNFDRAVYVFFDDEVSALQAFENREVDAVLTPRGLSSDAEGIEYRPTTNARFIVFNTAHVYLSDPVLRMSLGCVIDRGVLTSKVLSGKAFELDSFTLGVWKNGSADVCAGLDESARILRATQMLKARGYAWEQEPGSGAEGRGLFIPSSGLLPDVTLLVPARDDDLDKYQAGVYFAEQAQKLGLTVLLKETDAVYMTYKVFSSREYDLALVGWRLGAYPAHMCAWFGSGGQFDFGSASIHSNCDSLSVESNLEAALNFSSEIEASLANDAPFIPLYLDGAGEAFRGVQYPFEASFGDWYGAPSLAAPK